MITKKEINEKYNGVYRFTHTDSYGTFFELQLFTMGNVVAVRVYRGDALVFHRESTSYRKFSYAVRCFDSTKDWIVNEKDHLAMHEKFGADNTANYIDIRDKVQDWVKKNKRPMNIADAQILARPYKNKTIAMDMVYTAACTIANSPAYSSFRKHTNFSVQFSI